MPTLFSRRNTKLKSSANRYGTGISNTDVVAFRADSPSDQDARPLPDLPVDEHGRLVGGWSQNRHVSHNGDGMSHSRAEYGNHHGESPLPPLPPPVSPPLPPPPPSHNAAELSPSFDSAVQLPSAAHLGYGHGHAVPTDYGRSVGNGEARGGLASRSQRNGGGHRQYFTAPASTGRPKSSNGHAGGSRSSGGIGGGGLEHAVSVRSGRRNGPSSSSTAPRSTAYANSVATTAHAGTSAAPLLSPASPLPSRARPLQPYAYGYTNVGWDAQLDASSVATLVEACADQIRARGLDQPLIFSSMALDVSGHNVSGLIRSYLTHRRASAVGAAAATPSDLAWQPSGNVPLPRDFLQELRFANCHDLAALIKWSLARLGSVLAVPVPASEQPNRRGNVPEETIFVQQRGFLELDSYLWWREEERRRNYPPTAFSAFVDSLEDRAAQALLRALLSLLSSTVSYSLKNGMTPSKVSRLFGVLLFGLPEDETFERTYDAFVRASNATEHLLLAFIRDSATYGQLPVRLQEHVAGYPAMLTSDTSLSPKHVRGVPVVQVERVVREYSPDLVRSASEWGALAEQCGEWAACCSESDAHGRCPQLSDRYRKLLNARHIGKLGGGGVGGGGGGSGGSGATSATAGSATETSSSLGVGVGAGSGVGLDGVDVYSSLAEKDWGDFVDSGFAAPDESRLNFDLKESQRKALSQKRETLQWNDFTATGFAALDYGLDSLLDFDDALKAEVERGGAAGGGGGGERGEGGGRLRGAAKSKKVPSFPYDTTPHLVASPYLDGDAAGQWFHHPITRIDEAFTEVWADYLIGNGWSNRDESTHRSANWVLVQYKSRPGPSTVGTQSARERAQRGKASTATATATAGAGAGAGAGAPSLVSASVPRRNEYGETVSPDERTDSAWFVVQEIVPQQYRAELDEAGRLKGRSMPSLRKLKIFSRRSRRGDRGAPPLAPAPHQPQEDPFRPGSGGVTKHFNLDSTANLGHSSLESERRSERAPSHHRYDWGRDDGPAAGGGGSRLLSGLKSMARRNKRKEALVDQVPPVPPKDGLGRVAATDAARYALQQQQQQQPSSFYPDGQQLPTSAPLSGERGATHHQAKGSFGSSDFETRSLYEVGVTDEVDDDNDDDDDDDRVGQQGGGGGGGGAGRRGVGAKHRLLLRRGQQHDGKRASKDDSWLDVMIRANGFRMAGQDAGAMPESRQPSAEASSAAGGVGAASSVARAEAAPIPVTTSPPAAAPAAAATTSTPPKFVQGAASGGAVATSSRSPQHDSSPQPASRRGGASAASTSSVSPTSKARQRPERSYPAARPQTADQFDDAEEVAEAARPAVADEGTDVDAAASTSAAPVRKGSLPEASVLGAGNVTPKAKSGAASVATPTPPAAEPDAAALAVTPTPTGDSLSPARTPPSKKSSERLAQLAAEQAAASQPVQIKAPPSSETVLSRTEQERLEKERARQARIDAAKERARELRAGLTHVESRRLLEERERHRAAQGGASPTLATVPLAATTEAAAAAAAKAPASSSNKPTLALRDDPFAKDRTAGRVASIAGKFGGPGKPLLPLSPQPTGGSMVSPQRTGGSISEWAGVAAAAEASPQVAKARPSFPPPKVGGGGGGGSTVAGTSGNQAGGGSSSSSSIPTTPGSLVSPSLQMAGWPNDHEMPPSPRPRNSQDEVLVRHGVGGAGGGIGPTATVTASSSADNDSIYPDDAASNFSRRTVDFDAPAAGGAPASAEEEERSAALAGLRAAGAADDDDDDDEDEDVGQRQEVLSDDGSGVGVGKLGGFGGAAYAASRHAAAPSGGGGPDAGRSEEEDAATDMPAHFRVPYQPGLPLDLVAEESESMLSGSNNAG